MSAAACNTSGTTKWLMAVFCSLLLPTVYQAEGAVENNPGVTGPAFVLDDNSNSRTIWWVVSPYFSSSSPTLPDVAGPVNSVASKEPLDGDDVKKPAANSTKRVDRSAWYVDNSIKHVDSSASYVHNSTKSVVHSSVVDDSIGDSPSNALANSAHLSIDVPENSGDGSDKSVQNSITYGADDSLKGSTCQSMSSPGDGVCTPINDCLMYDDIKDALNNNTTLPYYFDSVHDKMACGFEEGPNTLICCEQAPLEIPPSMNILPPPYCGVQVTSTTRVVGGKPVNVPGTYPWLVELGYNRTNGNQSWECAGALVTERHVLTVAHCAYPKGLVMTKARIGALTLDHQGSDYWQERTVIDVRAHPEYNSSTKKHDIAVAVLANKVELTRYVHPICLPFTNDMKKMTFERKHPFIAGWGRVSYAGSPSDRLLQIQLAVRSNDECQSVYKKWNRQIYPTQMCAGEGDGAHDACRGDSGAPLMQPIGNFYYVIGLISFGYYCAVKGYPSVNTRVTEYIDWIAENIYDPI